MLRNDAVKTAFDSAALHVLAVTARETGVSERAQLSSDHSPSPD